MATATATIRVSRATRDVLATQARKRGVSVAALLADIAREREMATIWESEREAARVDAQSPAVRGEDQAWEAATADGLE